MDKPKTTPKDFFLWAGAMVSLFASIFAFIMLVFSYLNYAFPDPLNYYMSDPYSNGAAYQMATFIVFGALCLILLRVIHRTIETDATRADIWIRRWALFLTLFLAGISIAIDLIVLLTSFLNGEELTARFLLKVLLVLLVSAAAFMHFWADLKGYWTANPHLARRVSWGVGVLGILTIAVGFFILGTPWQARQYRLDEQRVGDLQQLQNEVINYYQLKQALPATLSDLNSSTGYFTVPNDPQTAQPYTYQKTDTLSFKLCATFNAPARANAYNGRSVPIMPAPYGVKGTQDSWQHGAGQTCFDRNIDTSLYPPIKR